MSINSVNSFANTYSASAPVYSKETTNTETAAVQAEPQEMFALSEQSEEPAPQKPNFATRIVRNAAGVVTGAIGAAAGATKGGLVGAAQGKVTIPRDAKVVLQAIGASAGLVAGLAVAGVVAGPIALVGGLVAGPWVGSMAGGMVGGAVEGLGSAIVGAGPGAVNGAKKGFDIGRTVID
ncbi:TPA: hypothetical protein DD394_08165, partial [bacterium UBP9_UBA11836]|nr:hypothetical protein [bacterium UBP9_UBA11836]